MIIRKIRQSMSKVVFSIHKKYLRMFGVSIGKRGMISIFATWICIGVKLLSETM